MKATLITYQRSTCEGSQLQGIQIEHTLEFRVTIQQHLKAAIQLETIHCICADSTSDLVCGFHQQAGDALRLQLPGTGQSSQAGPNDDGVVLHLRILF